MVLSEYWKRRRATEQIKKPHCVKCNTPTSKDASITYFRCEHCDAYNFKQGKVWKLDGVD